MILFCLQNDWILFGTRKALWMCSLSVLFSLVSLIGCGPSGFFSAEGVVTLDGDPLDDATVMFIAPGMPVASARTNQQGEFRMETGSINGIKPGEYAVTVTAFQKSPTTGKTIPKLATPEKYSKPETSELKVSIDSENSDIELALLSH